MADEIQQIVERLNQSPFKKNLRLVDFDEKSPIELLQILNDVFTNLEHQMAADIRDENQEVRVNRMLTFLSMLKFTIADNQREAIVRGLQMGEKAIIYPIMHWCLQKMPQLQKRAYLARYLMPAEIPAEYLQDDMLADLFTRLRELQEEFKQVHKSVDQLRNNNLRPSELRMEVTQLEDEKNQLQEKIAKMQRMTSSEPGFDDMLKVTSALRQEQEEEARLHEKMRDQRVALQSAEARLSEASKRLSALKQSTSGSGNSAEAILEQLQREIKELQGRVGESLPRELNDKQMLLDKLQRARLEPQKSKEDVDMVSREVDRLAAENKSAKERIEKMLVARGDDRLMLFRQHASIAANNRAAKEDEHASVAANNRAAKEDEVDTLMGERKQVQREIEEKESRISDLAGPKTMTREEFKAYGIKLREKTQVYKRLKQELAELRAESVVLHRTEHILKSRDRNLDDFLRKLEVRQGVFGFRETQEKLEKASEATAEVDAMKGQTLEEISNIVRDITYQLRDKKTKLQPQIKILKDARKQFQDVENAYFSKRSNYEKVAVGLEVERQQLEQECEAFQEECLREESRYHYLNALNGIMETQIEKIKQEEKWEAGEGRLLPDFRTYKELYQNKIAQQESLSKQLRKQQRSIKENEAQHSEQRQYFTDLKALLHIKLKIRQATSVQMMRGGAGGGGGGYMADDIGVGGSNLMMIGSRGREGESKHDV